MDQQLVLFDTPEPAPAKYSVFLAVFPPPLMARHIPDLAMEIRGRYGLHGGVRPLNHLHVSLYPLGGCFEVSERVIHFVGQICEVVVASMPAFEVRFDRVISFNGGRPGNCPLVLVNRSGGNAQLRKLRQALDTEFSKFRRRGGGNLRFDPHVTLLYDQQSIPEEPIEPVSWVVDEIALVFSEVGATKYERLGRWKLGD